MDWTAAYEQLLTGSPLAIGTALLLVAWSTRKSVLASIERFGKRLGRLEQHRAADQQAAYLERVRRWQLEVALQKAGVSLPPWPDTVDIEPEALSRHSERST